MVKPIRPIDVQRVHVRVVVVVRLLAERTEADSEVVPMLSEDDTLTDQKLGDMRRVHLVVLRLLDALVHLLILCLVTGEWVSTSSIRL